LLLYVDDIVLTASSAALLQQTVSALKREFAMKDLKALHFLGVSVQHQADELFLTQRQFSLDILEQARMVDCKPVLTPVDTQAKVSAESWPPVADPTHFRSLTGALQYLKFTRPDITSVVQQSYLHMLDSREPHLTTMKRTLCYLWGILDYALLLHRSTSSELMVYTYADLASCPDTRWYTSGYAVFLSANLVSWSLKHQNVIEACWLQQLHQKLHNPLIKSTLVYCDNVNTVYLSTNPIQRQHTKHIKIDIHFVRECVAIGDVHVLHVPTTSQFTDIFTDSLPTSVFLEFQYSLKIHSG
jgi:hypothetical protein